MELDERGIIVNPASIEKIDKKWKAPVDQIIEAYREHYKDKLISVYLRGSIPKGQAIERVSDIDTIALVDLPSSQLTTEWAENVSTSILETFPFVKAIEIDPISIKDGLSRSDVPIVLKTQSICVYGKDINSMFPDLHPGSETFIHLPNMEGIIKKWVRKIKDSKTEDEVRDNCTSVMKRLVRSGGELVAERSQKYTRDLFPSFQVFSEYYPEKRDEMRQILELAINPKIDKDVLVSIIESMGRWLFSEYLRVQKVNE